MLTLKRSLRPRYIRTCDIKQQHFNVKNNNLTLEFIFYIILTVKHVYLNNEVIIVFWTLPLSVIINGDMAVF